MARLFRRGVHQLPDRQKVVGETEKTWRLIVCFSHAESAQNNPLMGSKLPFQTANVVIFERQYLSSEFLTLTL